jgi:alpha-tubulin suppressor-like RCC1 family protein
LRAGFSDACAIDESGELWCVGDNQHQQLGPGSATGAAAVPLVGGAGAWTDVAIGDGHLCALGSDGSLWCAGSDGHGELGDGGGSPRMPTQVASNDQWTGVAAGIQQMCAVDGSGSVACAGDDTNDALGSSDQLLHSSMLPLTGVPAASAIAVGDYVGCLIGSPSGSGSGELYCWGTNQFAINGSSSSDHLLPKQVAAGAAAWTQISLYDQACGVQQDNTLWCWAANYYDQTGDGTGSSVPAPAQPASGTAWTVVTSGGDHTCMLAAGGSAQCFGANFNGQLGAGDLNSSANNIYGSPQAVLGGHTFTSIVAGASHTCAIESNGAAWCWGLGQQGQLGIGGFTGTENEPVAVVSDKTWTQLAAGSAHTCGIATGSSLWCWGDNTRGELGDGTHDYRTTPVQVGSDTSWKQLAAGNDFTCAIKTDGTLWCWGQNDAGQLAYAKAFSASFVNVP